MIRSHFGLSKDPFSKQHVELLEHQQEIFDILKIHSQQGGLCVVIGESGVGKTEIKVKIRSLTEKRNIEVPTMNRTMHTYINIIKQLLEAFKLEERHTVKDCESNIIQEAFRMNGDGKAIATIIDDAHLMAMEVCRKLRLLFDEFPKNHNLILIGEIDLLQRLALTSNEDIKSRITYSAKIDKLNPDQMKKFIQRELDHCGLGFSSFDEGAVELIVRSSAGIIRLCKNLCLGSLVQAVVERKRRVDIKIVNTVLTQPHWRTYEELLQC